MRLIDLFLPTNCVRCDAPPMVLCEECANQIDQKLQPVKRHGLHGYCLLEYNDQTRPLFHAFKERSAFAVAKLLATRLAELQPRPDVDLLLAAPSAKTSFRKRGFVPATVVAQTLGRHWRLPTLTAKQQRQVADQAALSIEQRARNLAGSIAVGQSLAGRRVWLVDDITTTGATLTELAAAARAAGAEVAGFSTLAETLLKTATQK